MRELLRLSEHSLSLQWLAHFRNSEDRALAARLLNELKLVSGRQFETCIEQELIKLQEKLKGTLAVYPVSSPIDEGIAGYDPFTGGIKKNEEEASREAGRRRKYGSEDRVGHLLSKIQGRFKRPSGASLIECSPTLTQLGTQGIKHIVLVDDICGSGKRITDYWHKVVPKRIKSLLSYHKLELWIVLYSISSAGKKQIMESIPNFPVNNHLLPVMGEHNFIKGLDSEIIDLCKRYADLHNIGGAPLGYKGSACSVVFEHGCPNNLPAILWVSKGRWKGLFPNRAIPAEMRSCFDGIGIDRAVEALWRSNQRNLAISLLDAIDHSKPMESQHWMLLALLGLRLRGIAESELSLRLMLERDMSMQLLQLGHKLGLYDIKAGNVTRLGQEIVARFRQRFIQKTAKLGVGKCLSDYYPQQCEGRFLEPGKTEGEDLSVPTEP